MKKLLALGILATALPLVMQQNVNNKDAVNALNDALNEQAPNLCAESGGGTFEGSIIICDGIDFMQIGVLQNYPANGKYVLGQDVTLTNHKAPAATFTGTIDGRGKVINSSTRFDYYLQDSYYNLGLFYKVGNNATFKNFEIKNTSSYSGENSYDFKIGTLSANVVATDGEILVDNVQVQSTYSITDINEVYYGGLFGRVSLTQKARMTIQNVTTKTTMTQSQNGTPLSANTNYLGGIAGYVIANSNDEEQDFNKINMINNNIGSTITANAEGHQASKMVGGIFGRLETNTNSIVNIERNVVTSTISNTYGNDLRIGGSFGYAIMYSKSKLRYSNSILRSTINCSWNTNLSYIGGIFGYNYVLSTAQVLVKSNSLYTTASVSGTTTESRMGGLVGYSDSALGANTTFDGIFIYGGTLSNGASTNVYAGGLAGFIVNSSATISTHNFNNIIKYLPTPSSNGGSSVKLLRDYFAFWTENMQEPNTKNIFYVTENPPTRAVDAKAVQKNQLTYDFFTSGQIDMDIDAWQIQPNTEFVDTNGNITFYLRIDSKASNQVANNDPSQDDVFGLEEIFVPKTINWWFLLVIAAVLGFTFWLYMWNKNRKRYEK